MELLGELVQVHVLEELLYGLRAHASLEVVLIFLPVVPVLLLRENLVAAQGRLAGVRDNIVGEVQHLLQNPGADVQQQAHPGGDALEIPNVAHRRGQLDVAHPLPADLGPGDLHAAAVADFPLVADFLVLAAVALPVLGGPEDALAEEAVPLGLQGAVVDGLGLLHLAVGPGADLLRGGHADFYGIKGDISAGFVVGHIARSSFIAPDLFNERIIRRRPRRRQTRRRCPPRRPRGHPRCHNRTPGTPPPGPRYRRCGCARRPRPSGPG